MYSEWRSLYKDIETSQQHISVLHTFPENSARDISCVVVRCLSQAASNTNYAADSISIHSLVSQQFGSNNGALLQDENQVRWTMQALCYALSLPFSEYETINECVQVYCGWLTTSLLPANQQRVGSVNYGDRYGNEKQKYVAPAVVRENANAYAQEMFAHFRNLFIPRSVSSTSTSSLPQATAATSSTASFGSGGNNQCDLLTKQTVLCRRVLNTVRSVARYSEMLSSETWTALLSFLIAANDLLLSPPSGDELNEQLGAVALNALIDCWLIACARHFPSPSLWKTLVEVCKRWRHHDALVTQWFRATYILTVYVLRNVFHLPVPNCVLPTDADELCSMPQTVGMSSEAIVNAWFRFLHALGNPVDLAHANVIGTTDAFARAASSWNPDTLALSEHPCLSNLPIIFAHAMRTLATLVDAFLDTFHVTAAQLQASSSGSAPQAASAQGSTSSSTSNLNSGSIPDRSTPLLGGKLPIKSTVMSIADREVKGGAPKKSLVLPTNPATNLPNSAAPPTQIHPNVMPPAGSLVMLNGAPYRVTAVHMPTQSTTAQQNSNSYADLLANRPGMCTLASAPSANRLHFSVNTILHLFRNWLFEAAVTGVRVEIRPTDSYISLRSSTIDTTAFETGRAEAAGALCRIFCSHRTNEQIFSRYLARFYICLHQGLRVGEQQNGLVLASILYYSSNLLRCDLDGVFVLLPRITSAIESVLICEGDLKFKIPEFISVVELRRASINLLLSCVCLPLHFGNIEIRELSMLISDVQRRQSMIALYGGSSAPASAPADVPTFTFLSFKQRFISLMVKVVPMERDPQNLHMLLCGLILTLIDLTMHDQATSNEPTPGSVKRLAESEPGTLRRPADNASVIHEAEDDYRLTMGKTSQHGPVQPSLSSLTNSDSLSSVPLATGFKTHAAFAEQREYSTTSSLFDSLVTLIYGRLNKELSTTVTALEALAALARLRIPNNTCTMTPGQIVHNLCDWIASQIGKPQTLQTRDLHSTLVAAYSVVQLWLTEHPYVLLDRMVQHLVLETIELGISGSKSQPRNTDPKKYKDAKGRHPNPASKRVLEAADSLLMTVLDQVGSFPPPSGPESTWSLVDELTVLEYCKPYSALLSDVSAPGTGLQQHAMLGSDSASSASLPSSAGINTLLRDPFGVLTHRRQPSEQEVNNFGASTKHASVPNSVASLRVDTSFKPPFRYFAIENSLILCLCEQPLSGANELVPALTAIVRGPFGRHAWCMHMRHLPVGAASYAAPPPDPTLVNVRLVTQPHPVSVARRYSKSTDRPTPCGSYATFERRASPRYFPESVDHAPFTKADASIPPLEQVGNERRTELDILKATISKQTEAEQRVADRIRNEKLNAPFPNPETECRRPNSAVEFQTARMFLMHYGFLTLDGIRPDYNPHSVQQSPSHAVAAPSSLSLLDCSTTDFFAQLELLDQLPTRSTDLAFAFYVRAGQRTVEEILQNANALNREKQYAYFTEFLLAVGWPVDPQTHNGWAGNTHESLHNFALRQKTSLNESDSSSENGGASVQMRKVPGRMILQAGAPVDLTVPIDYDCFYWADIQRELALLVPRICVTSANNDAVNSGVKLKVNSNSSVDSAFEQPASRNGPDSAHEANQVRIRSDIAELLDGDSDARRSMPSGPTSQVDGRTPRSCAPKRIVSHSPEVRIFIFWLETFEDKDTLPISELLQTFPFSDGVTRDREKDVYVIGLHLLQTGLIRVIVQQLLPTVSKYGMAGPCVDGMVVSRRALGSLVRETVINIHRRRRLEAADGQYQPPHVRRRMKIQEIINKYKCRMIEPDFFVSLFQEP